MGPAFKKRAKKPQKPDPDFCYDVGKTKIVKELTVSNIQTTIAPSKTMEIYDIIYSKMCQQYFLSFPNFFQSPGSVKYFKIPVDKLRLS